MITSISNLEAGLRWWLNGKWPSDIHSSDYYDIYDARNSGITANWWEVTVNRLSQWRAYRSPKPPNTKGEIQERGRKILSQLARDYEQIRSKCDDEPSITTLQWEDLDALFLLVAQIKPRSAVFAGKLCHFIFPKVFIVMDNLGTQVLDYEFYWRGMKDEWVRFKEKDKAVKILRNAIKSDKPLHVHYPVETKIMELSHIGYKHR